MESLPVVSTVLLGATLVTKCSLATDYNHKENVEPDVTAQNDEEEIMR